MILVKLCGGLGNQMFQYAAARRLAQKHGTRLIIDLSWFDSEAAIKAGRKYGLEIFNLKSRIANSRELAKLREVRADSKMKKWFDMMFSFAYIDHVKESTYHFDPGILQLGDNVCLDGYWQTEKYFKDIEHIIRTEFVFNDKLTALNERIESAIRSSNSVSLHIRRGDYVTNPTAASVLGICQLDYYYKAIKMIAEKVSNPHFFIFSDDLKWVKEHLRTDQQFSYVEYGASRDHADLKLMSLCKHNIVANSSFSWWGAWLNNHPDKLVIAPKEWFADTSYNTQDLLPDSWLKL